MPVYNAALFLREAIDSILNQSFPDFTFLIINDGSTDASLSILQTYTDKRIEIVQFEQNKGLITALNTGLALSKDSDYIIRMDADDVADAKRVERQIDFMEKHPEVAICGTLAMTTDGKRMNRYLKPYELKAWLFYHCVLVHPTVIIRNEVINKEQLTFAERYLHAEDYQLWSVISQKHEMAVLPEILSYYRISENQISQKENNIQLINSSIIRKELFEWHLNRKLTDTEVAIVSFRFNEIKSITQVIHFLKHSQANMRSFKKGHLRPVFKKIMLHYYYNLPSRGFNLIHCIRSGFLNSREQISLLIQYCSIQINQHN